MKKYKSILKIVKKLLDKLFELIVKFILNVKPHK